MLNYRVIVEQDEGGVFVASAPSLQGCYTEGDTFEEALENIKDAIKLHLDARKKERIIDDDSQTEFVGVKNISMTFSSENDISGSLNLL